MLGLRPLEQPTKGFPSFGFGLQFEIVNRVLVNVFDRLVDRVGVQVQLLVARRDRALFYHVIDVLHKFCMVVAIHNPDRKSRNFLRLDECDGLEKFIERTEPARHDHEAVRVLEQKHFADKEIPNVHRSVEIRVRLLLEGQLDVHSDTPTTYGLGTPIGGLHDSRTTPGHDGKPKLGDLTCDLHGFSVLWGLFPESG